MGNIEDKIELLPELQSSQVDILRNILNILSLNNIPYYLTGGSVLGSVHYQGFLPYDDDIDIAIPRDGYIKLINIIKKNPSIFGEKTYATHFSIDRDFDYPIIKVFNLKYNVMSLLDNDREVSHPFLDIAPLDGAPKGNIKKIFFNIEFKFLAKAYAYTTKKINPNEKNVYLYKVELIVSKMASYLVKYDPLFFLRKLDKLISKNKISNSELAGTLLGRYGLKELLPISDWGNGATGTFEKLSVSLPSKTEKYILDLYGGYKKYSKNDFLKERHIIILGRNRA